MHLGLKPGDVCPRILSVGDAGRGERLSHLLTSASSVTSIRGFVTYSGLFDEVPVSIVVTGMGVAMMDFVVREASFHVAGRLAMARLGTCGVLQEHVRPGGVVVAGAARMLQQNYDYPDGPMFRLSQRVPADRLLTDSVKEILQQSLGVDRVSEGVDVTCETFYNSQGRMDERFSDCEKGLVDRVGEEEQDVYAMEMETFKLLHLAKCSQGKIAATACMIGLMNRKTGEVMDFSQLHETELAAGRAVLKALTSYSIE
jgi:uridine phosphorylase